MNGGLGGAINLSPSPPNQPVLSLWRYCYFGSREVLVCLDFFFFLLLGGGGGGGGGCGGGVGGWGGVFVCVFVCVCVCVC